jgi:hypothetical protein
MDVEILEDELKSSAEESANWRGHELGEWSRHSWKPRISIANCIHCNMQVAVNIAPLPNEIDIGGEAVALNCKE